MSPDTAVCPMQLGMSKYILGQVAAAGNFNKLLEFKVGGTGYGGKRSPHFCGNVFLATTTLVTKVGSTYPQCPLASLCTHATKIQFKPASKLYN